jgi:hypothetical protein
MLYGLLSDATITGFFSSKMGQKFLTEGLESGKLFTKAGETVAGKTGIVRATDEINS